MFVERDWKEMSGRWFTGAYDETGIDVKLVRLGSRSGRLRLGPDGAQDGDDRPRAQDLRRQPAGERQAGRHRLRSGRQGDAGRQRDARRDRGRGRRRARTRRSARGTSRWPARSSRRRWSSTTGSTASRSCRWPAWRASAAPCSRSNSSSSRPSACTTGPTASRTPPTISNLGMVDVKWSVEEYTATFGDDDIAVCRRARSTRACSRRTSTDRTRSGAATGTTSATSGWSPSSSPGGGTPQKPLRARAHLLVTVPVYMAWFDRRQDNDQLGRRGNIIASRRPAGRSSIWCRAPRSSRWTTPPTRSCGG